jgi:hypothetical protein
MKTAAWLSVFLFAAASLAQSPAAADLGALEQTAQKRQAEWEDAAKTLEERLARILPCDARSAAAITEVSRLSEARLAALNDYVRAASSRAFAEAAAIRLLLSAEEKREGEAVRERSDAGQEQTAVEIQMDALKQSISQRSSLQDPQKLLDQIVALIQQRTAETERQAGAADKANVLLRELAAKFEARDAALREESAAFEAERTRWSGYYTARQARAQTECSITQAGVARPAAPAKPQSKSPGKAKQ